jgi:hypothetical protein
MSSFDSLQHTLCRPLLWLGVWLLLPCILSQAASGNDLQNDLRRLNRLKLSESAKLYSPDSGEAAAFQDYKFVCRRQADHVPAETPAARSAFQFFVDAARARTDPDEEDLRRRLDLLSQAVAAGSWRARYFNAMWSIWVAHSSPEGRSQFGHLLAMAQDGNPAALHGLLTWTNGMHDDMPQRIRVLQAAIDRGNPQAMSIVGFDLGTRTHKLRPMALKMLNCAAAQGDGDAYQGLGRIAWLEGRWIDAYRAWQRGANLGCADCLTQMEQASPKGPGFEPSPNTYGPEPSIAALRTFYESQFLYSISHLIELRVPAPAAIWVQWSDEQVVANIEARIRMFGLP